MMKWLRQQWRQRCLADRRMRNHPALTAIRCAFAGLWVVCLAVIVACALVVSLVEEWMGRAGDAEKDD